MKLFKINRRHIVDTSDVDRFSFHNKEIWVYMKPPHYPPILKADCSIQTLKLRLLNTGENPNMYDRR